MNYYEILGVGPEATDQQIKDAYRREAMKWHPDRHEGAAAKGEADRRFKSLALAYRTLRDKAARADYDLELTHRLRQEFESRQTEEARNQKARSQQTQQKRSQEDRPKQDFDEKGARFEDDTVSNDEANRIFYEQMLGLASDLARRGFPEFNISQALIALGCPEALAKAVSATASQQEAWQKSKSESARQTNSHGSMDSNSELVVRPKRHLTILGALFGLYIIFECIVAWLAPDGGGRHGSYQLAYRYIAGPFGVLLLIFYGQVSMANAWIVVDNKGVRFTRGGGQITKWSEIKDFSFDGKNLLFSGVKNKKIWKTTVPGMFVSGNCQEIIFRISKIRDQHSY